MEAEAYQCNERLKAEANSEVQSAIQMQSLNVAAARRDDRVEIEAYVQGIETGRQEFKVTIERVKREASTKDSRIKIYGQ